MNLNQHVQAARDRLRLAGISAPTAAVDAEVLARHVLGWTRATWFARLAEAPPHDFAARLDAALVRRERREPVAFITGVREFWGLQFRTTADALIPRHETELIVEEALEIARAAASGLRVVDVGTGSGCVAVSLALELPAARVLALDVSETALRLARENAARLGAVVTFVRSDLLACVAGPVDLIVSNPPYVCSTSAPGLQPEVREYEPAVALYGGPDGLGVLRRLLAQAAQILAPGGALVVEFGYGQEDAVREIAAATPLQLAKIRHDLQGIARVAVLRPRASSTSATT